MDEKLIRHASRQSMITDALQFASISLLYYDLCLTFDLELALIWRSAWNRVKVLYIITRYLPLAIGTMLIAYRLSQAQCRIVSLELSSLLLDLGLGSAQAILALRTWAVWGKSRALATILVMSLSISWGVGTVCISIFVFSIKNPPPALASKGFHCYISGANPALLTTQLIMATVFDAVMLSLISIRAYAYLRGLGRSRFLNIIYRDGVFYTLLLLILETLNIVLYFVLPRSYNGVLSLPLDALLSILTSRVVLNARREGCMDCDSEPSIISGVEFALTTLDTSVY